MCENISQSLKCLRRERLDQRVCVTADHQFNVWRIHFWRRSASCKDDPDPVMMTDLWLWCTVKALEVLDNWGLVDTI